MILGSAIPAGSLYVEAVLEATRIALPLQQIQRVVRAANLLAVPGAPDCLLGALDLAGELVAVYDTRRMLGLSRRPMRASDCIVVSRQPAACGLLVDDVLGTVETARTDAVPFFPMQAAGVRGVARTGTGMLLVHDLRRLLATQSAIPIASHA